MVKHKLYRDFTLVLTVAVIASIAFVSFAFATRVFI